MIIVVCCVPTSMTTPIDDAAVAAADKEMEERANRAKELLSRRYTGLKKSQVRPPPRRS